MKSDHFDGKYFFNPGVRHRETPGAVMKLLFEMARSPRWNVPQETGTPQLDLALGEGDIALTFVNHVTFILQTRELTVLTDPVWADRASPVSFTGPQRYRPPGVALDKLPHIDLVLISHNHFDHMDLPTLKILKERFDPEFIVGLGDARHLATVGITKVHELDWWEKVSVRGTEVIYTPAQHFSSRSLFDRDLSLWGGHWFKIAGQSVYFAGDTGYSNHFKEIRERLGAPDLALLPIGAYEPYWFMGPVHMNPGDAVRAHLDLETKQSVGMHFGTFKLTAELWDEPIKELARCLESRGLDPKTFVVPREGYTVVYKQADLLRSTGSGGLTRP